MIMWNEVKKSRKNGKERKVDKQKERERLNRLYDLFWPILMDVINWKSWPKPTNEEILAEIKASRPELADVEPVKLSTEDGAEIDKAVLRPIARVIAARWLRSLIDNFTNTPLTKDSLTDCMLPKGKFLNLVHGLSEEITNEHAYETLDRVRASLPEGEFLPEDAKEILRGRGIQIT